MGAVGPEEPTAGGPAPETRRDETASRLTVPVMDETALGAPGGDEASRRVAQEKARHELVSAGVNPPVKLPTWRSDGYGALEDDYHLELPQLVLAVPQRRARFGQPDAVRFAGGRHWLAVDHQCAGLACEHVTMIATVLPIRPEAAEGLFRLERRWYDSQVGAFGLALDTVEAYRDDLARLGLDCNSTFADLREALYPIDPTPEHLALVTTAGLPEDLDDLLEFQSPWARIAGMLSRWRCYLLGVNSD